MSLTVCPLCGATAKARDGAIWTRCEACRAMLFREGGGPRVLIMHESEEMSAQIGAVLLAAGLHPIHAPTLVQALRVIDGQAPAAAVVDVGMSGLGAFQFIEHVKNTALHVSTKVVLVASVFNRAAYKRRPSSLYGADDYVEQHHIPDMLPAKIRSLLGMSELETAQDTTERVEAIKGAEEGSYDDTQARRLADKLVGDIALYNEPELLTVAAGGSSPRLQDSLAEGRRLLREQLGAEPVEGDPIGDALNRLLERLRTAAAPPADTERLETAEPSDRVAERYRRAQELDVTQPGAVAQLIELLGDENWRVRKAAQRAVARFEPGDELVRALVSSLASSENAGLRTASAEVLQRLGDAADRALLVALDEGDQDVRKFVVEVLGSRDKVHVRARIIQALNDPDENVRSSAAGVLGRWGGQEIVAVLRAQLAQDASDTQRTAYLLRALLDAGEKLSAAEIQRWSADAALQRLVLEMWGRCGSKEAIVPLCAAARRSGRSAKQLAIRGLAQLMRALPQEDRAELRAAVASPDMLPALREALYDPDIDTNRASLRLMSLVGDVRLAPTLVEAGTDRPLVREVLVTLADLGPSVVDVLLDEYHGISQEAQLLALEAVAGLGTAKHVPKLLELLQNSEPQHGESIVRVLGQLGDASVVPQLIELGSQVDADLAHHVGFALAAIGRRYSAPVLERMRAKFDGGEHLPAWLYVLGVLGDNDDTGRLNMALHSTDPEVRKAAVEACQDFAGEIREETLILCLADENARVREATAKALSGHDEGWVVDALMVATADPDPWVVRAAVSALGHTSAPRAAAVLLEHAARDESPIAIAALQGLMRHPVAGLEGVLARALDHADEEVVREAVVTSARLGHNQAKPLLQRALLHPSWQVRLAAAEGVEARGIALDQSVLNACLAREDEPTIVETLEAILKVTA